MSLIQANIKAHRHMQLDFKEGPEVWLEAAEMYTLQSSLILQMIFHT